MILIDSMYANLSFALIGQLKFPRGPKDTPESTVLFNIWKCTIDNFH